MKFLKVASVAASLLLLGSPAFAQLGSDSDQFVQAVEKSDGDKATQLLQDHPTIVDSRNSKGDTALIIAINRGDRNWTGFLLNKNADPNLASRGNGDTPLIAAARAGFDEAAQWLIEMGAKVDAANRMGETALIVAVQRRETPLVKLLLKAGADPDRADAAAGYSARDYAIRDPRAREILQAIDAKKPRPATTQR